MLHHRIIAAFGALLLAACSGEPQESGVPSADIVADLTAQADRWDKAIAGKDRAAVEANMAEDFRQIDRAGNVETKASFVDGDEPFTSHYRYIDVYVRRGGAWKIVSVQISPIPDALAASS